MTNNSNHVQLRFFLWPAQFNRHTDAGIKPIVIKHSTKILICLLFVLNKIKLAPPKWGLHVIHNERPWVSIWRGRIGARKFLLGLWWSSERLRELATPISRRICTLSKCRTKCCVLVYRNSWVTKKIWIEHGLHSHEWVNSK